MPSGEKTMFSEMRQGILVDSSGTFNLSQIVNSGQCFRLVEYPHRNYVAVTGNHMVDISYISLTDSYLFRCSRRDFEDIWYPYFDFDTDYQIFQEKMQDDLFLRDAIQTGGGIRILRQDIWETVITFVISQRNNIPRIRGSVNKLCQEYGTLIGYDRFENPHYSFPTPEQLRGKDLSVASLGYRAKYVEMLTYYNGSYWKKLVEMSDMEAKEALLGIHGVGEKVANCIMLFGLHRMDSYPRDVWINRLIDDVYHGVFDAGKYEGFAGYVQQLQFYHYRKIQKGGKE